MAPSKHTRVMWRTRLRMGVLCAPLWGCSGGVAEESPKQDGDTVTPIDANDAAASGAPESDSAGPSPKPTPGDANDVPVSPSPTNGTDQPAAQVAQESVLRLTQVEINHSLRDVLGDSNNTASTLLSEDEFSPFDNNAGRQLVSPSLIDSVHALAQDVAARVAYDSTKRSVWMPCAPAAADDAECFDATAAKLTRQLFRRKVSDSETTSYRRFLALAAEASDFYYGVELLISALVQDPEFLYRMERPTGGTLNDYEIATRLSFLLAGTTPDDALLRDADSGALAAATGRANAALRILESDLSKRQMFRIHAMWLGYRSIPHDAQLNAAFQLETEQLIDRIVFTEPRSYLELFQSLETYLTPELADHYGLPRPEGDQGWVMYPSNSRRAGILSHGSVLSGFSKFDDTSPTQRGIFVRTRLLCQPVQSPPPAVNVDQPPGGEEANGACKLDRYRAHQEQSGCRECHQLFDPIGVGLERFDRAGRYREHDDADETCVIDGSGELPGYGTFDGPGELAQLLTQHGAIQNCLVRHLMRYARGTDVLGPEDEKFATDMVTSLEDANLILKDWLPKWVADERFVRPLEGSL